MDHQLSNDLEWNIQSPLQTELFEDLLSFLDPDCKTSSSSTNNLDLKNLFLGSSGENLSACAFDFEAEAEDWLKELAATDEKLEEAVAGANEYGNSSIASVEGSKIEWAEATPTPPIAMDEEVSMPTTSSTIGLAAGRSRRKTSMTKVENREDDIIFFDGSGMEVEDQQMQVPQLESGEVKKRGRKRKGATTTKTVKPALIKKAKKNAAAAAKVKKEEKDKMWKLDPKQHPEAKNSVLAKQRRERKKREEREKNQKIAEQEEIIKNYQENYIHKDDYHGLCNRVVELGTKLGEIQVVFEVDGNSALKDGSTSG